MNKVQPQPRALSQRILVVDDAPTVRQLLQVMLEQAHHQVDVVGSADEAREAIAQQGYDVLIVDKNLEDGDGFAVCRLARDHLPHAAFILVTADQSVESAIQAVEEDIFAYLTKPLRKREVLFRVRRALERVRLAREREEARAETEAAKEALERRTAELEQALEQLLRTQARLAESDKLVSMGMLAAGVAHEINNPACFIVPNFEYIKRGGHRLGELALAAGAPVTEVEQQLGHLARMVDRCQEGIARIQQVVGTLQLFSRREPAATCPVDLSALCRSLLDLVAHELGDRAELLVDLRPVSKVLAREKDLAQAVLNLLLNARRSVFASPQSGGHTIALRCEQRDGLVALSVTDSGPPLGQEGDARHLDAFLVGEGGASAGLHLSLVRDILDRHQGQLQISRQGGQNMLEAILPAIVES